MLKDKTTGLIFEHYAEYDEPKRGEPKHWAFLCENHAVHSDPNLQEYHDQGEYHDGCGVKGCKRNAHYTYDFNGQLTKGNTMAKKLSKVEVKKIFIALLNSCQEGHSGNWDCSTDEGKEGFEDMRDNLTELADHFGVDVSEAKEI